MKREAIFLVMFALTVGAAAFLAFSDAIAAFDVTPLYEAGGFSVRVAQFIEGIQQFLASTAVALIGGMIGNVFGYLHAWYRALDNGEPEGPDYELNKLLKTLMFYETPAVTFGFAIPGHGAWIGAVIGLIFQVIQMVYHNLFGAAREPG